jgi:hypothetical protein
MHEGVPDKHESHGALQISRCQHSSTALFGSSILHDNIIRLRISAAEMERRNNTDYLYYSPSKKDTYVEVEMSYVQFAEAMISLNQGVGVPVTVRYANGRSMEPCPYTSKDERFRAEFNADLRELAQTIDGAVNRAKTLFNSKKPLTKTEKDEILSALQSLSMEIKSNIPYVRDLFVEQMDKTVMEAKGNIEGFIQNRMAVIANEAIAQNIGALNDGGGTAALLRPESGEKPSVLERIRAGVPQNNHNAPSGDKKARTDRE